jgi:hypothetical protein
MGFDGMWRNKTFAAGVQKGDFMIQGKVLVCVIH